MKTHNNMSYHKKQYYTQNDSLNTLNLLLHIIIITRCNLIITFFKICNIIVFRIFFFCYSDYLKLIIKSNNHLHFSLLRFLNQLYQINYNTCVTSQQYNTSSNLNIYVLYSFFVKIIKIFRDKKGIFYIIDFKTNIWIKKINKN